MARAIAAVLAACVLVTGAVLVPAAAETAASNSLTAMAATGGVSDPVECTGEAATVDAAAALAAECGGESVTITGSLTPWETAVLDAGSGDVVVTTSTEAQRQDSDGDGQWGPIDVQVVPSPVSTGELEGMLLVTGGVSPMWFNPGGPAGADLPLVVLGQAGERVGMHSGSLPIGLAGAAVVTENGVSYDFGQGVMLSVTADRDGVRATPVVELADPAALEYLTGELLPEEDTSPLALSFPLETSPGLSVQSGEAGFEVVDSDGQVQYESGPALQWDSAGGDAAAARTFAAAATEGSAAATTEGGSEGPSTGDNVAVMEMQVSADGVVTVTPDAQMLADPATSWPVSLDPELGAATPWGYTMVQNYSG